MLHPIFRSRVPFLLSCAGRKSISLLRRVCLLYSSFPGPTGPKKISPSGFYPPTPFHSLCLFPFQHFELSSFAPPPLHVITHIPLPLFAVLPLGSSNFAVHFNTSCFFLRFHPLRFSRPLRPCPHLSIISLSPRLSLGSRCATCLQLKAPSGLDRSRFARRPVPRKQLLQGAATPDPIRTPKLGAPGREQCWDGGPPGKSSRCAHFLLVYPNFILFYFILFVRLCQRELQIAASTRMFCRILLLSARGLKNMAFRLRGSLFA